MMQIAKYNIQYLQLPTGTCCWNIIMNNTEQNLST
jgi:hypothetical protein